MIKLETVIMFKPGAVTDRIPPAKRRALSKIGSYVRQTARRSIRKRKKVSEPGQPPTDRTGKLKRFIYFGYDQQAEDVAVGPVLLGGGRSNVEPQGTTAPGLMEHGGRATRRRRRRGQVETEQLDYEARPFMGPALEKEAQNDRLLDAWRNSVR